MDSKTKRIGVMGGTFDPVHNGHLVLAETVREQFGLDQVLFVPAADPPHKLHREITPAGHRLAMVRLAVETNPHFQVSTVEIDRGGTSYTIDTIRELRNHSEEPVHFYFITGADAIMEILSWKEVETLCSLCFFVAATRSGTDGAKLTAFLESLPTSVRECIHLTRMPSLEISSTDIRQKVSEGRSIRYLLPETVRLYIGNEGLYV